MRIPKFTFLLVLLITTCTLSKAQVNYASNFNPATTEQASGMFPSMLASGDVKFSFNLLGVYASASDNRLSFQDINQLISGNSISIADISNLVNKLQPGDNRISINAEIQIFDCSFRIKSKKGNNLYIQVGSRDRIEANIQIPKNIFSLALNGNAQWAGQNVNLGPVAASGIWYRENYIGLAKAIHVGNCILYPAVRFNYVQGIANIYTEEGNANLYTDPAGEYLTMQANYKVDAAYPQQASDALMNPSGKGVAMDAGLGLSIGSHILMNAGVTDIGVITFTNNTHQYYNDTTVTYKGVPVVIDNSESGNVNYSVNGYSNLFNTHQSNTSYTTPLPAQAAYQLEYRCGYSAKKNIYRNHFYGSVVMGFNNYYGATTKPQYAFGYTRSFGRLLDLGINASAGGYYPMAAGAFISFHPGPFHFEIGTNNASYFINPQDCYGAAAYVVMGLAFR